MKKENEKEVKNIKDDKFLSNTHLILTSILRV